MPTPGSGTQGPATSLSSKKNQVFAGKWLVLRLGQEKEVSPNHFTLPESINK